MVAVAHVIFSMACSILFWSSNTMYMPCLLLARNCLGNFFQITGVLYRIVNICIQDGGIPSLRPGFEMSTQVFFKGRGTP